MNGVTPDPSDPIRDGDALSRLKLAQALQRATYAIAWERAWPNLARLLTVVGLFLVVSWAGLWLALPSIARAIGLVVFAGVAIVSCCCELIAHSGNGLGPVRLKQPPSGTHSANATKTRIARTPPTHGLVPAGIMHAIAVAHKRTASPG